MLSNIERHHRLPLNRAITTKVIYRLGELSQIIVQIHCNYLNISETWPPLEGRSLSFGCSPTRQVTTKQQVQLDKMRIIQQTDLSWPVVDSVSSASGCVHFYFSKPHDRCGGVFKKFWDFFFFLLKLKKWPTVKNVTLAFVLLWENVEVANPPNRLTGQVRSTVGTFVPRCV